MSGFCNLDIFRRALVGSFDGVVTGVIAVVGWEIRNRACELRDSKAGVLRNHARVGNTQV